VGGDEIRHCHRSSVSGRWIGVDPEMSRASAVACDLYVNGVNVLSDYADRGDGTEATCMVQV
jgi:hypothetical protein